MNRLTACTLGLALMIAPSVSASASSDVPFTDRQISIAARGQSIRDFLADLFAQAGLRAKISNVPTGKVQGVFVGKAADVWAQISRAYSVGAYFDGGLVRVFHTSEVTSRTISTERPDAIVAEVRRMQIGDGVNTVRASRNLVMATGIPAFLDRVEAMSGKLATVPPVVAPAAVVTDPGFTTVASPLRGAGARLPVRSEVIIPAGIRSPFEVRMFHLRYRDAADKEVRSSDRTTLVPGVARLLIEQMGDGQAVGAVSTSDSNVFSTSGLNRLGRGSRGGGGFYGDEVVPAPDDARAGGAAVRTGLDGPRISADSTNNSVIVRDRPEMMAIYEKLVANLDIEPVMIETQVTIIEVNTSRMKELGADFSLGIGGLRLAFGGDVGGSRTTGDISGGYLSGNGDAFNVRIRALEQQGALRVVTRPVLSAPSNQVAVFDNTTQQIVKLQGEREVDAFSVNYGLAMRIRPSAIEDGGELRIRMQIEISDTQLNGLVVDGVPTASGPRISTQTIVKQGESVMLAGMTSTREFDAKSKTPILGDVPLLGQAFRKRNRGESRMERLFLLTPRIISLGSATTVSQVLPDPIPLSQISGKRPRR